MAKLPESVIRYMRERQELEEKLGPRGYAELQVNSALDQIRAALTGIGGDAVHGDDDQDGLLSFLESQAEDCAEGIPHEHVEKLASVIGLAFDLGKYAAGGGADQEALQRYKFACSRGGEASRKDARERSGRWKTIAWPIWRGNDGLLSDPKIASKAAAALQKEHGVHVSERTILNEIKKWKKRPNSRLSGTH